MTIASLAMYPYRQLRPAYDQLWDSVRSRLSVPTPALDWAVDHLVACRRDDLVLGQTCGWPLITELAPTVRVVGTFDCDVDGAVDGTYCSVLVSSTGETLGDILRRTDLTVAANARDSLSGWISLLSVAAAHDVRLDTVEWTGSHAASVDAVRRGGAHLASIDAVSLAHLGTSGLSIVGHGPRVPSLPLVTAGSSTDAFLDELRAALTAAVRDPSMTETRATLRIREFLARDLADYEGLSTFAELW